MRKTKSATSTIDDRCAAMRNTIVMIIEIFHKKQSVSVKTDGWESVREVVHPDRALILLEGRERLWDAGPRREDNAVLVDESISTELPKISFRNAPRSRNRHSSSKLHWGVSEVLPT